MDSTHTPDDLILERIQTGKKFIERGIAERDKNHCKKFLDGSEAAALLLLDSDDFDGVGELPNSQEVGSVNYLATNVLTKCSSIAIADPDFHIEAPEADFAQIVRRLLRELWKTRRWARTTRKALLKRCISGMGFIAYLWDEDEGPVIEHVRAKDLFVDPCVVDWNALEWGGRRIRMPRAKAEERYPDWADLFPVSQSDIPNLDADLTISKEYIELYLYFDKPTEAHVYGDQVIEKTDNLYGRVPILTFEGEIAPESPFSLGDYDLATGLQQMLARLTGIINNIAENGGAIGWVKTALLAEGNRDAFENGRPSKFVEIEGADADEVFGYISAEPLGQALMEAFQLAMKGLDASTGVNEYQRGVIQSDPKFATQAAMLNNLAGSRATLTRIEFELFIDQICRVIVEMMLQFGPTKLAQDADADPEGLDSLLYDALSSVQDIAVIEASTSYKDPASEQQSNLQLLQALMPFIQAGLVDPAPIISDLLRSFGKRDVQKYLLQLPQPQDPTLLDGNPAPAEAPPGAGGFSPLPPAPGSTAAGTMQT